MAIRLAQRGGGAAHRLQGARVGVGPGHFRRQRHHYPQREQVGGRNLQSGSGQDVQTEGAGLLTGRRGKDVVARLAVSDGRPETVKLGPEFVRFDGRFGARHYFPAGGIRETEITSPPLFIFHPSKKCFFFNYLQKKRCQIKIWLIALQSAFIQSQWVA